MSENTGGVRVQAARGWAAIPGATPISDSIVRLLGLPQAARTATLGRATLAYKFGRLVHLAVLRPSRRRLTRPNLWFLQKTSSSPKRVRAVSIGRFPSATLTVPRSEGAADDNYVWHGFVMQDSRKRHDRRLRPEQVHALVRTTREYANPDRAIKVHVDEVFAVRTDADRALMAKRLAQPGSIWAVVTYPVGEMLF